MKLKQLSKKIVLSIAMGLAVMQGPLYFKTLHAQENHEAVLDETYDSSKDEDHKTGDLDKLLDNYQRESDQILQDYSALEGGLDGDNKQFSEEDLEMLDQAGVGQRQKQAILKSPESGYRKNYFHVLKKARSGKELTLDERVSLALVPLQNLSDADLKEFFHKSFKDSKIEELFNKYPVIVDKMILIIRSDEVIPNFVKMSQDKDRMIYFVSAILVTFIFGFITKRIFYGPKSSFLGMCGGFILHGFFMFLVRLGVIFFFYRNELTPLINIIYDTKL